MQAGEGGELRRIIEGPSMSQVAIACSSRPGARCLDAPSMNHRRAFEEVSVDEFPSTAARRSSGLRQPRVTDGPPRATSDYTKTVGRWGVIQSLGLVPSTAWAEGGNPSPRVTRIGR